MGIDYKKRREEKYIGKKFGKLTITKEIGLSKWRKPIVLCKCDCGKDFECLLGNILYRNVHQCNSCRYVGFKNSKKSEMGLNLLLRQYKSGAKNKNIDFKLNKKEFKEITSSNCHYCGVEPSNNTHKGKSNYKNESVLEYNDYVHNGIDRIDSDLPYQKDNCVPCCKVCNKIKMDLSKDDFMVQISKIYVNMNLGGFND